MNLANLPTRTIENKLKPNCLESEYRAHPALGSSDIKNIIGNARKFNLIKTGQYKEEKEAFRLGRAFHSLLLEPETFFDCNHVVKSISERIVGLAKRSNYVVAPCRGSAAKAYKDMEAEFPDKEVITEKDFELIGEILPHIEKNLLNKGEFEQIESLVQKCVDLPGFSRYLETGTKEQSYFGEIDGVPVKCRIDLFVNYKDTDQVIIFDPKSTAKENTPDTFVKSSANNYYYLQEWLYTEVLKQNGFKVKDYIFVQTSSVEYSGAGYYKHDYIAMERAEEEVRRALKKYKYCRDKNKWSENNYDHATDEFDVVNEIALPNYIFYRNE